MAGRKNRTNNGQWRTICPKDQRVFQGKAPQVKTYDLAARMRAAAKKRKA